eukprot:c15018_g1_i1.p1 GENE.c15018_g1_i1~~c15018_g1_i1.p1  ORF type:complete len:268 (-),score=34.86 c15018_g1_i1:58-861(-)
MASLGVVAVHCARMLNPISFADSCPICLGPVIRPTFIHPCFHTFCFSCIVRWLGIRQSCPLCKQSAVYLLCDVQSDMSYKRVAIDENLQTNPNPSPSIMSGRLLVYRHGLRCLPFAGFENAPLPKRQHFTPNRISRIKPWLDREVTAALSVTAPSAEDDPSAILLVVALASSLLERYGMDPAKISEEIQGFLHDKTDIFVHELKWFLVSSLDLVGYDFSVRYSLPDAMQVHRTQPICQYQSSCVFIATIAVDIKNETPDESRHKTSK